jgi:hypothetical protein
VGTRNPEQELAQFLAAQPEWCRKWLAHDPTLSAEEQVAWLKSSGLEGMTMRRQYEKLLKKVPARWREYRERCQQLAQTMVPAGNPGRPRKDALASEARELVGNGLSYAQAATALNHKYGPETTNKESLRKLLKLRERPPEKTHR